VVFTVPDLKAAVGYYSAFGLDVRHTPHQVDLHTHGHSQCWASILPGGTKKVLQYLVFAAFEEDMAEIRKRVESLPYSHGTPHPLGSLFRSLLQPNVLRKKNYRRS
jgi:hypothetical protein